MLTVIGLSAKNSILIVEYAKDLHESGRGLFEATVLAVRMRLRPISMTPLCFLLGVVPLAVSSGAGSGGQNALGTTVVAGVLAATCLGRYYTPGLFRGGDQAVLPEKKTAEEKMPEEIGARVVPGSA